MNTDAKLAEFVAARNAVYEDVRRELAAGRKETHWVWYIFPQLAGLGFSPMARKYALNSLTEALCYWEHPVLGSRLRECIEILLALPSRDISSILGPPDDLKFRSCLTLFAATAPEDPIFVAALDKFVAGDRDPLTIARLEQSAQ